MAPSRRSRNSSSSAKSSTQSPRLNSPSHSHADPPTTKLNHDQDAQKETVSSGSSGSSGPADDSTMSIDPSLLDEEVTAEDERKDLPGQVGRTYATGGGYNALKSFKGQVYSGMAVGGSHTWNYDQGVWHEVKEEPDLWQIDYKTTKRRARTAPKGSGAPVGTEYHWLIVAHQVSSKWHANKEPKTYSLCFFAYSMLRRSTPTHTRRTLLDPSISSHTRQPHPTRGQFPKFGASASARSSSSKTLRDVSKGCHLC
jgi:hypothetical protein